ncbi:MAG: RNA polymerase sporulation sigma factor SigF [Defluviitaleaceae bacterium]|nr:RNA polymerase sporulation sigma factor SigF [Defluviitaleaceae bacterium]
MTEILALIARAQEGDNDAAERLIKENSGLIWSVVKKFTKRGYEPDDLFQIGAIGLLKCIRKFDSSFDVKFSTYAIPMIIGEIKRFLRDDGIIKVSRPMKELATKARYATEMLTAKNGRQPTIGELAAEIGVTAEEIIVANEATTDVESLHATIYQGDGSPIFLIDKVAQNMEDKDQNINILALKQLIERLKPKERQVIVLRYFQDKTQMEVAKAIGVSQVQVSRIEKKVLQSLKNALADES